MIGLMALNLAIGFGRGYSEKVSAKALRRSGRRIRAEYQKLGRYKAENQKIADEHKKTIKNIQQEQHKQATLQVEWNKKEINRALETNLRGVLANYSNAREELKNEIYNAKSTLSFQNDIKNVEESSIKTDSANRLKEEANNASQVIINNQLNDVSQVEEQAGAQFYQTGLDYNRTIEGVNQNYLASLTNAEMQLIRDNAQLDSFINQGASYGETFINKGNQMVTQANQQMLGSVLDFGIGAFKRYGANTALGKFLGLKPQEELKELPMTFKPNQNVNVPTFLKGV